MVFSACKKVLIANRGEIACRIIRTLRRLGLQSVVLASTPDLGTPATRLADEVIHLPGARTDATYLNAELFLPIAKKLGVTAIHPGYGFLSENADFAELCAQSGIKFIGPSPDAIRQLGNKVSAKLIAEKVKVPVSAHCELSAKNPLKEAEKFCEKNGLPVVIKAAGGGGGRGMRLVTKVSELETSLAAASREAAAFFKDSKIFLEQYIFPARHIEVQLLGDEHGNIFAIGDRDCTFQRRYQKVIEEAPAPELSSKLRTKLHRFAVALGKAANYFGAGTVEFLVQGDQVFFLEVNSRLQVEHPVTEAAYGIDLVEQQIRVASGEVLDSTLSSLNPNCHAIELRLTSEQPENNFAPSTGTIKAFEFPESASLRVDSGFEVGSHVTHYYDSLIAKLIISEPTRELAIDVAKRLLSDTFVAGVRTNSKFLARLLAEPSFSSATHHVTLAESLVAPAESELGKLFAAAIFVASQKQDQLFSASMPKTLPIQQIILDDQPLSVSICTNGASLLICADDRTIELTLNRQQQLIHYSNNTYRYGLSPGEPSWIKILDSYYRCEWMSMATSSDGHVVKELRAPLPGRITNLQIAEGQNVEQGQPLVVIESMKMEHVLKATSHGIVRKLALEVGKAVQKNDLILVID